MRMLKKAAALILALCLLATGCLGMAEIPVKTEGDEWHFGFGCSTIVPDEDGDEPLYIAGYKNGVEITGVLDYCQARAVWLDTGAEGVLLIGVDCVGLDSGTVGRIRSALSDLADCAVINVYSTHTHAGIDSLGLWGPVGINGKSDAYMDALVAAAEAAGREAAENRRPGKLYFGKAKTEIMLYDSRYPYVYDPNLYQLRAEAADGSAGLRMFFYGAHAESLRGNNNLLSRDFPGALCDGITEATGDDAIFLPGAIGGLIMTEEFKNTSGAKAVENMQITAQQLIDYALTIRPEDERELSPAMTQNREMFTLLLDNVVFLMYKFLGILGTKAVPGKSATGYAVESELSVLMLGDLAVALIPGEIFPELVTGEAYGEANPDGVNPRPLLEIAAEYGVEDMLIVGLANDELGYIVPPSDFLLNEDLPYLSRTRDYWGEDHYEETNSVGPACADAIADAFEAAIAGVN